MEIRIRIASPGDAPGTGTAGALREGRRKDPTCFLQAPDNHVKNLERIGEYPKMFGGANAGSANNLCVLPKYRKLGIGSSVLEYAESRLKTRGAKHTAIQVTPRLPWLHDLYGRRKYREHERSYFKKLV